MAHGIDPHRTSLEAASWNVRLDSGQLTNADRAELHEWLATPSNAREYDAQRQLLGWVEDLPPQMKEELEALCGPVHPSAALHQRLRARPLWLGAATLGLVGAAFTVGPVVRTSLEMLMPHSYTSGVGEVRTFGLPDGSTTLLNTRTHLRWLGGSHDRRVELLTGEVLFEVKHQPAHPFQIELKHSRITVLGTRFDVYEKPDDDVEVTVLSGVVVIQGSGASGPWTEELTSNQQIEYTPAGPGRVRVVDPSNATYWRNGLLVTEGMPLGRVVGELSRYTSMRIIIADPSLKQVVVGGVFPIHDVASALERVVRATTYVPITVTRAPGAFVLSRGAEPGSAGNTS